MVYRFPEHVLRDVKIHANCIIIQVVAAFEGRNAMARCFPILHFSIDERERAESLVEKNRVLAIKLCT